AVAIRKGCALTDHMSGEFRRTAISEEQDFGSNGRFRARPLNAAGSGNEQSEDGKNVGGTCLTPYEERCGKGEESGCKQPPQRGPRQIPARNNARGVCNSSPQQGLPSMR